MTSFLPDTLDVHRAGQISRLRALGYTQSQIATQLDISQQTVSRYLKQIRLAADAADDPQSLLWDLLIIGAGAAAVVGLLRLIQR